MENKQTSIDSEQPENETSPKLDIAGRPISERLSPPIENTEEFQVMKKQFRRGGTGPLPERIARFTAQNPLLAVGVACGVGAIATILYLSNRYRNS